MTGAALCNPARPASFLRRAIPSERNPCMPRHALLMVMLAFVAAAPAQAQAQAQGPYQGHYPPDHHRDHQGGHQRGADPSFTVLNNTSVPLAQLFASSAAARDWGHDRLAGAMLPPGEARPIRLDPRAGCVIDLRAVQADGAVRDLRGVDTCATPRVVLGQPLPHELLLENRGRQVVTLAYVSPAGQRDWGMDRLEGRPLLPGAAMRLPLPPGECVFDIRAVTERGVPLDHRGVDLCIQPRLVLP